ncbi:MAG: (Citrate (pro-3S)-lyase) ligase [Firmicutes bacterium ADurb.Bin182]|nr:MAG: (Citrate (pro-3S)-lyase) ligase [Firmicutes bacterium ADurb.Bin182]
MFTETGAPPSGALLNRTKRFLQSQGLRFDDDVEFTVNLLDEDGEIVATGSLAHNVLKCIAVKEGLRGEGTAATIVSELATQSFHLGRTHLFLFTKPENEEQFASLGFYPMAATGDVLMMENRKTGIDDYVKSLKKPEAGGKIGTVVVNCNPFTLGHQYLMETASSRVDALHVFVLSEDRSQFPADLRYRLVLEGVSHLKNVYVHKSGDYIISSATFPTYFLKESVKPDEVNGTLDLTLFAKRIAKPLGITVRFVGTEPFCPTTARYNLLMKKILPRYGIEVVELERKDQISASKVRKLMAEGKLEEIKKLVPETTYRAISDILKAENRR